MHLRPRFKKPVFLFICSTFFSSVIFINNGRINYEKRIFNPKHAVEQLPVSMDRSRQINHYEQRHPAANEIPRSEIRQQFEKFFSRDLKVLNMQDYFQECNNPNNRLIIASIMETETGLGAVINNALNGFVFALEDSVHRQFRMLFGDWAYTPLDVFFDDLGTNFSCSFFEHLPLPSLPQYRESLRSLTDFELWFDEDERITKISGGSTVAIRFLHGVSWTRMRKVIERIVARDGLARIFDIKARMLQAIWSPNDRFKELTYDLWTEVIDSHGRFFGVHIRRGDKITDGEMESIETKAYIEKIEEICLDLGENCPRNILVMSDDNAAIAEFTKLAQSAFIVMSAASSMRRLAPALRTFTLSAAERKYRGTRVRDGQFMDEITAELILSLTVMSMADHVVCTHSSNICRMLALLKGDMDQDVVHSLDSDWVLDIRYVKL